MGLKDLMQKLIGEDTDLFGNEKEAQEEEFEDISGRPSHRASSSDSSFSGSGSSFDFDDDYRERDRERESRRPMPRARKYQPTYENDGEKVVDIRTVHTTAKLEVVFSKPERFDSVSDIADNLNNKRTVILNLDSAEKPEVARRLVDFLSGVAYANGGQIKKVANNTFIITPYNVDISGDLVDEIETTGIFF